MQTVSRDTIFTNYGNEFDLLNPHLHSQPLDKQKQQQCIREGTRIYKCERPPVQIVDPITAELRDMTSNDPIGNNVLRIFNMTDAVLSTHDVRYFEHVVRRVNIVQKLQKMGLNLNQSNEYILAYNHWSSNIYHFMTEQLPTILCVNQFFGHSRVPVLCVNTSFLAPLLRFFDVNNPVQTIPQAYLHIPQVNAVYEQKYIECGNPSPQKIHALRSVIVKKCFQSELESDSKSKNDIPIGILIHRKETKRSIQNHDALLALLKTKRPDLEWHVFSTQPLDEAISLFNRATIIVAPHGAGLTNMLFAPPNTKIVEFMPTANPNVCYYHLATLLQFQHCMVGCDSLPNLSLVAPLDIIEKMDI